MNEFLAFQNELQVSKFIPSIDKKGKVFVTKKVGIFISLLREHVEKNWSYSSLLEIRRELRYIYFSQKGKLQYIFSSLYHEYRVTFDTKL